MTAERVPSSSLRATIGRSFWARPAKPLMRVSDTDSDSGNKRTKAISWP